MALVIVVVSSWLAMAKSQLGGDANGAVACPIPPGTIPNGTASWAWPENLPATRATRNTGKYKVLMVRHAQSLANTLDPYFIKSCTTSVGFAGCNHSFDPRDSPLTAEGIATAKEQGQSKTLDSLDVPDVILISPLLRTIQTAMSVIPSAWLHPKAVERTPPKIYFMPWLSEVVAPNTSTRDKGVWTQPTYQSCGHPSNTWFNGYCPPNQTGACLDYNNTRATCMGYQGIKQWTKLYVDVPNGAGYNGFYNKTFFDMWDHNPSEAFGRAPQQHVDSMWQLLNTELSRSKVMIVSHHQLLMLLIDWPESSPPYMDPFAGHDGPRFLCLGTPWSTRVLYA